MLSASTPWRLAVHNRGGLTVVRPAGSLVCLHEPDIARLRRGLFHLAERSAGRHLVVDLSDVLFLTSSTVEVLLALRRRLHALGGRLSVWNPSETVREVLGALKLEQVLDIRTVPDDAGTDAPA